MPQTMNHEVVHHLSQDGPGATTMLLLLGGALLIFWVLEND